MTTKTTQLSLGTQLQTNKWYQLGEILLVFLSAIALIELLRPLAGDNPIKKQAVVWAANILMLALVWAGGKIRGESWRDFGLSLKWPGWKEAGKIFLLSLLVFVLAILGFALGAIIMANITGVPENANLSGFDYLKGNLGMLLLTLLGVYIVSSFGEEVIYRAFLINRFSQMGLSPALAVGGSAIIFGLVHYDWGPMGMVQTAFMGLALGICYLWLKKRLWILILAHAYMDTILIVQLYLQ